ncbi:MAG TPA: AAA family ATPase [Trebonia sp.]|nr:AAA family ATPase [Trebonia sp.]
MSLPEAARRAQQATREIITAMDSAPRGVVVDSPPGAGKSTLVVRVAGELVGRGHRVMVIAQTNEQVDDLAGALARSLAHDGELRVGRLAAGTYATPERLAGLANLTAARTIGELDRCQVVASTAAKWATVKSDTPWPWAIVDEAYQMRSDLLLRVAGLFEKALFVGDPGQLDPFSTVESDRWLGLSWDPTRSAVAVMLAHNDHVPVKQLPVSWRLPASAAPVVSAAFYPFSPFDAATTHADRRLEWETTPFGKSPVDATLDLAASTGWALHELPAGHKPRTDREAVAACAALAARLLSRGAIATSERGVAPVTADRIAIGSAHRDQVAAIRAELARLGCDDVIADTSNRLQGREFDVTIVLHPLSGRRDATAFHLEAGRLCVLTSRHRHACIVVARRGIPELLDAHPSAEPMHLNVPVKFPDGWEAHQSLMSHLSTHRIPAP